MKFNFHLLQAAVVGALGGLLFGFDTAVIAGTTHQLTVVYNLTPVTLGLTVSIALWGTIIGSLSAGVVGQKLGSREALRILAILYLVSALGCTFAWNWPSLMIARAIGGLGIGGSSVLGPVYIAEISPGKWRGRLVGMFQINIVIGILLAYFSNYCIARLGLGAGEWRWMLGIAAIPALLFFLLLFRIPPSPRGLVMQNRTEEARSVLQLIGSPDADAELREIIESAHLERSQQAEPIFSRKYRLPILLAITLGTFSQLSGVNAILYYLNDIFAAAGFGGASGGLLAVAVGATNLLATLIAMTVIDKLGRKPLLLTGSVGTAICLAGVSTIFFMQRHQGFLVWFLILYVAFFAFSQGAVIWVYIGEIFPNRVRSKGQSFGSSSHWIANAFIAGLFPLAARHSRAYPFVFFTSMAILQFFVVLFFFPETKGVSLEQMPYLLGIEG
jgi:SP family arabinose:H+ symporter-like MFS transporter